ncbi:hypothetical protein ElyMa_004770800 [Elysia marginata]|uniref:Uncharacterized protein n=1 Tax=Elysia marginata TaxID=1093978 RepID=A0AAV4IKJ3_9GAST|nr:hypothetical protein ElyMa_004770800 [Elysia marginata]
MFRRKIRLPFQIPRPTERPRSAPPQHASDTQSDNNLRCRGPYKVGNKVLARLPHVLKGQSPWSKPLSVIAVLGNWTYRLSDGQVWNARKLYRP